MPPPNHFCIRCKRPHEGNEYLTVDFKTVGGRCEWRVTVCRDCYEDVVQYLEHPSEFISFHELRQQCSHAMREAYLLTRPTSLEIGTPIWSWRCKLCGYIQKE